MLCEEYRERRVLCVCVNGFVSMCVSVCVSMCECLCECLYM